MSRRHDPSIVSEDELRRYMRAASVLLATAAPPATQRVALLRRARHWAAAVLDGVDQLLREAEAPDETTGPLTPSRDEPTIEVER